MKNSFHALWIDFESSGQRFGNSRELDDDLGALPGERWHAHGVEQLCGQASVGIAWYGDVIDVGKGQAGFFQTITNGFGGKSGSVLDAIEALFFDGGDELAVAY
jgi:hypothetical protein